MASTTHHDLDTQDFQQIKESVMTYESETSEVLGIHRDQDTQCKPSGDHIERSGTPVPSRASLLEAFVDMNTINPRNPVFESTQPIETQVYEDYYSSRAQSSKAIGNTNATRATYATGDTGYVDLVGQFDANETVRPDEEQDGDAQNTQRSIIGQSLSSDEESEDELAMGSQAQTTPRVMLETPGYAGKKRDHSGNIISSVERTPAPNYAAMFPGMQSKGAVGLSQVFQDTQADSSPPLPADIRSDPIFDRPSPVFDRALRSTPALTNSSPVLATKPGRSLSTAEPRSAYQPVDESQRQRELQERQRQVRSSPSGSLGQVEWDDDEDEINMQAKIRRARNRLNASREFSELRAPGHTYSTRRRPFTTSESVIGLMSTRRGTPRKSREDVIDISSDHVIPEVSDGSSDHESQDEYDELSQVVIPSERSEPKLPSPNKPVGSAVKSLYLARPTSSPIRGRHDGTSAKPLLYARPVSDIGRRPAYTSSTYREPMLPVKQVTSVVANSQPEIDTQHSPLPPRPFLPSSITDREFISQSQLASLSSNTREDLANLPHVMDINALDTSSIPPPPVRDSIPPPGDADEGKQVELPSSSPFRVPSSTKPLSKSAPDDHTGEQDQPAESAPTPSTRITRHTSNPVIPETSPANAASAPPARSETLLSPSTVESSRSSHAATGAQSEAPADTNSDKYQTARTQPSEPLSSSYNKNRSPRPTQPSSKPTTASGQADNMPVAMPSASQNYPLQAVDLENINIMGADEMDFQTAMLTKPQEAPPSKRSRRSNLASEMKTPEAEPTVPLMPQSPLSTRRSTRSSQAPPSMTRPKETVHIPAQPKRGKLKRPRSTGEKSAAPVALDTVVRANVDEAVTAGTTRSTTVFKSTKTTQDAVAPNIEPPQDQPKQHQQAKASPETSRTLPITINTGLVQRRDASDIQGEIRVPNRVWARFRDLSSTPRFYPATSIALATSGPSAYQCKFDDGVVDTVEDHLVKSLDLQIGDLVKVDRNGFRKPTYAITGFKDMWDGSAAAEGEDPKTDIRGHATVVLEPVQRASIPGTDRLQPPRAISMSVAELYITNALWPRYERRGIGQAVPLQTTESRLHTPVLQVSEPSTPSSRTRRHTMTSVAQSTTNLANSTSDTKTGMFSNMAFAVSYSSNKVSDRARVTDLIQQNGGQILPDGFEQLFVPPIADTEQDLTLRNAFQNLGFVALIADTHSRRTKYMQALALNIPCLAGRWIVDCVSKEALQSWQPYLLAAGESTFLDGVVRSRVIAGLADGPESYATTRASATVEHRPKLVQSQSILLLGTGSRGKHDERSNTFLFLAIALGARRALLVKDEAELRERLFTERWDLICVDDARVKDVRRGLEAEVSGGGHAPAKAGSKRRRRGSGVDDFVLEPVDIANCKVVGHAYVVQSLVLGALVED